MKNYPVKGERWGRVQCVDYLDKYKVINNNGLEIDYRGIVFLIACECGNEIELTKLEWAGKKHIKDCGCGISLLDGISLSRSINLPVLTWKKVEDYARANTGSNRSKAFQVLVEAGLGIDEEVITTGQLEAKNA